MKRNVVVGLLIIQSILIVFFTTVFASNPFLNTDGVFNLMDIVASVLGVFGGELLFAGFLFIVYGSVDYILDLRKYNQVKNIQSPEQNISYLFNNAWKPGVILAGCAFTVVGGFLFHIINIILY